MMVGSFNRNFVFLPPPSAALGRAQRTQPVPSNGPVTKEKAIAATFAYLDRHPSQAGLSGRAGQVRAEQSYQVKSVFGDQLGMTHVRLDRVLEGIPVVGYEIISHLDKSGKVVGITNYNKPIPTDFKPKVVLTPKQAEAKAKADLDPFGDEKVKSTKPELGICLSASDKQYHTVYQLTLTSDAGDSEDYMVDAETGKVYAQ